MPSILSIDDLSESEVDRILVRAAELCTAPRAGTVRCDRMLALVFVEPSLRTRLGFAAAAARLGWQSTNVFELRGRSATRLESWSDTLRTIAGYADAIVARPGRPLGDADRTDVGDCPLINGGDTGTAAEHPSQALIDVFAIEQLIGPIRETSVAIVGDPRMRAVRSLLALLARRSPAALALVVDSDHLREITLPLRLESLVRLRFWETLGDVDLIYVAGIPHESLPLDRREALLVTAEKLGKLPRRCALMSPMPVIDEMAAAVRGSARNLMYQQSQLGLYVRMAVLEHVSRESA